MRRVPSTFVLALLLFGCSASQSGRSAASPGDLVSPSPVGEAGSPVPSGDAVELATAEGDFPERSDGVHVCPYNFNVGLLMADPEYGTAAQNQDGIHPLIWPLGYTARQLPGGEVAVLNREGAVVATTGKRYRFWAPAWGTGTGPVEAGDCVDPYPEGEVMTPLPT